MLKLSPRLSAAAALVRPGRKVCDVGTDHGYLPAYLVMRGVTDRCIASDVGEGPLENARCTLERYSLTDRIELRLSDGLAGIAPDEAEDILLCGMGGTLIERILTAAPWVRNERTHLILQPMTHIEDARRYLCENGFETDSESVVYDEGRYYLTISAYYTGAACEKSVGWQFFGDGLRDAPGGDKITAKQLRRVRTRLGALEKADRLPGEQETLREALAYYERITADEG